MEAIDAERDALQAELDNKAEMVANLTEELDLGHQQADTANRSVTALHPTMREAAVQIQLKLSPEAM